VKKKKINIGKILYMAMTLCAGMGAGLVVGMNSPMLDMDRDLDLPTFMLYMGVSLLLMYLAIFIQLIIHETGHLVFGLLSGYRFSSFRILNLLMKRENGRFVFKKFSLGGTGGQCLMCPPDMQDGKIPYVLYNLGGVILNVITSAVFSAAALAVKAAGGSAGFLIYLAVFGLFLALTNGVPYNGPIPNDGYNALHLGKDPAALKSFWAQLKVNDASSRDVHLRDMPDEWFELPEGADMENQMTTSLAVLDANRTMDKKDFASARSMIEYLTGGECALVGIYKTMLRNDLVYIDLIEKGKEADVSLLTSKENKAFFRQMRDQLSVMRTAYAAALISRGDRAEADGIRERFERVAAAYPSNAEAQGEREYMDIALRKYEQDPAGAAE